jgi:hypothetical protein
MIFDKYGILMHSSDEDLREVVDDYGFLHFVFEKGRYITDDYGNILSLEGVWITDNYGNSVLIWRKVSELFEE